MDHSKTRMCKEHYQASLRCIEKNYENKDEACKDLFEQYKACKKEETRERHLRNNGGKEQTFYPWGNKLSDLWTK